MFSTSDQVLINQRLADIYGKHPNDNRPTFRLVWSEYSVKRFGHYDLYSEDGTFKEHYDGVLEVPAYPMFPPCWILEGLSITNDPNNAEKITYEPLYTFLDKNNEQLEPCWRAIEIIVHALRNPQPKKSLHEMHMDDERKVKEDAARIRQELENVKRVEKTNPHSVNLDSRRIILPGEF